MAVSSS